MTDTTEVAVGDVAPWPAPDGRGPTGARALWERIGRRWRVAIVVVVAFLALDAVIAAVQSATVGHAPVGPDASSFSPTPAGLQGLAELLTGQGRSVTQVQAQLSPSNLPLGGPAALVVADAVNWSPDQNTAVTTFVETGGRLVLAGQPPAGLLTDLFGAGAPQWQPAPASSSSSDSTADAVSSAPEVAGVSTVDLGPPDGIWIDPGGTTPILASSDGVVATAVSLGSGRVVLLSTSTPLEDQRLGNDDNAAFALNAVGPRGTTVLFDEYDHGYGRSGAGLAGLPVQWRAALWLALAALAVWALSAVRRFGPVEEPERALPPDRIRYVDALGATLSRAAPDEVAGAIEPVRRRARIRLCARLGIPADANDDAIVHAATGSALPHELVAAVLSSPTDAPGVMAVGRALAVLDRPGGGRP